MFLPCFFRIPSFLCHDIFFPSPSVISLFSLSICLLFLHAPVPVVSYSVLSFISFFSSLPLLHPFLPFPWFFFLSPSFFSLFNPSICLFFLHVIVHVVDFSVLSFISFLALLLFHYLHPLSIYTFPFPLNHSLFFSPSIYLLFLH